MGSFCFPVFPVFIALGSVDLCCCLSFFFFFYVKVQRVSRTGVLQESVGPKVSTASIFQHVPFKKLYVHFYSSLTKTHFLKTGLLCNPIAQIAYNGFDEQQHINTLAWVIRWAVERANRASVSTVCLMLEIRYPVSQITREVDSFCCCCCLLQQAEPGGKTSETKINTIGPSIFLFLVSFPYAQLARMRLGCWISFEEPVYQDFQLVFQRHLTACQVMMCLSVLGIQLSLRHTFASVHTWLSHLIQYV